MKIGGPARTVILCGLTLVLFSALFSLAAWYDWWPRLPAGALHDTDLWAGLACGAALFALLLRRGPGLWSRREESPRGEADSPPRAAGAERRS